MGNHLTVIHAENSGGIECASVSSVTPWLIRFSPAKAPNRPTDNSAMDSIAIAPETAAAASNRRRTARCTFITKAMLYRDDRAAGPKRVTIKNVSLIGMGFESSQPVEPGTRCHLRFEAGPTRISWKIQVICCGRIEDNLFHLGAQFITSDLECAYSTEPAFDLSEIRELAILQ
jgi:hypothetical protein